MAGIKVQRTKDRTTVSLDGDLTVRDAKEIKAALHEALRDAAAAEVVLGAVGAMDSSFPQLLCSAHRTAAEMNRVFTVSGADHPAFVDLLRRSGFIRHTGCRESTRATCLWLLGPVSD